MRYRRESIKRVLATQPLSKVFWRDCHALRVDHSKVGVFEAKGQVSLLQSHGGRRLEPKAHPEVDSSEMNL